MNSKFITQGAEAKIFSSGSKITKERISKAYRLPELDKKLRKTRTKKEIKLLEKASHVISVPKVISSTDYEIVMQHIPGKKLAFDLEKMKNKNDVAKQIGLSVSKIHDLGIIHGDLTTSNMIWHNNKLWLIDFGLGFESQNIEDKAVDIHVFKEALEARHHKYASKMFKSFILGYQNSKQSSLVIKRLETVEKRGRYKAQF